MPLLLLSLLAFIAIMAIIGYFIFHDYDEED
jgi:hypothetical protein